MMRQIWHILFGHLWTLERLLPILYLTQYSIEFAKDVLVETHYSRCVCGIRRYGYSAITERLI